MDSLHVCHEFDVSQVQQIECIPGSDSQSIYMGAQLAQKWWPRGSPLTLPHTSRTWQLHRGTMTWLDSPSRRNEASHAHTRRLLSQSKITRLTSGAGSLVARTFVKAVPIECTSSVVRKGSIETGRVTWKVQGLLQASYATLHERVANEKSRIPVEPQSLP